MAANNATTIRALFDQIAPASLTGSLRGVERECLRVDERGRLATSGHPRALGSALTHPWITTDFSEALLEFVTPPSESPWEVIQFLCELHQFTHDHIGDESLWPLSMPCGVEGDEDIPLALYGSSNVGTMKTVYRRGLGYRYGRTMQTIAGLHFNFSPGDDFWRALWAARGGNGDFGRFKSAAYFVLVRNFRRIAWLVLYLFGASPAVCKSFLAGREHGLDELDAETLYLPHATSLRMSNLGYSNLAQAHLNISVNSPEEYVAGLARAIRTPYPDYARIGTKVDGKWRQLSANILQIANEYYSVVRPKRTARSGEEPTHALRDRGVEYVEIRALDLSPADPVGVSRRQLRFLDCLMYDCALGKTRVISAREQAAIDRNQGLVATRGRDPGLKLARRARDVTLRDRALSVFDRLEVVAESLDAAAGKNDHAEAVAGFRETVERPELTPSATVLREMRDAGLSHVAYGCQLASRHKAYFRNLSGLSAARREQFTDVARESLAQQAAIEAADEIDFESYLRRYFNQV